MKKKFIRDISANTLQLIISQFCGLLIFYLLSTKLSKNDFGEINWTLAILLTSFGILAFGIDQISIRRIASGKDPVKMLSVYFGHVLLTGSVFYILLWAGSLLFPSFFQQHHLLLLLGIAKLMIFFSTPFKQLATGLEKFRPLLVMAVCSNVLRSILLIAFALSGQFDLHTVVIIFIAGDLAELLLCIIIMRYIIKVPVVLKWDKTEYRGLIKESLPQSGVALFAAALTRLDWIFLGLLTNNIILAEYSFAYKVFEVATLPMLVVAPVLIPRFTKLFEASASELPTAKANDLLVLLRLEMIIASLTGLVLCILWSPVIDLLTQDKYGSVNQYTIIFLSASMPFLYFNNFLWTINFARGKLKMIFYVFLVSFIVNLVGDIILIPFFKAEGAAVAYLIAIITQSVIYFQNTELQGLKKNAYAVLLCPIGALTGGYIAATLFDSVLMALTGSVIFFAMLLYFTRQIRGSDWAVLKRVSGF
jgi:O-antigen/teichoic acid export membrane protein